jgi:hypothetical protein
MKMKTYCRWMFLASILAFASCSPAAETNTPVNDTSRLDDMSKGDQKCSQFAQKVELYYQALQKKDWPTSYDMRTADFKQDVNKALYLKQMADGRENLTSYKVLNVHLFGGMDGNYTAAEMIMEFTEGRMVSYSCARWIRRGGNWMCDEPGLSGLLTSTRIPDWITN